MSSSPCPTALEVAPQEHWFKSSYSGDNGAGGCISVTLLTDHVGVRDSKQHNGPAVITPSAAWASFIREVRAGRWAA
ncbi:DUF397 domain-containing protein [Streptosporangium nondiastaticum]|uniref:DUF397 domain-containing protein n=2 Tax=Actinomycetes TaxID=1760 RepID=A0A9X7PHZ3_9ACTN|nr:DUF397 domain-containing protein [Streptosporangium nondiastaticum]PSJ28567.1 DUF397 domain-containing protein [Streptosporangium nondiastaticum]